MTEIPLSLQLIIWFHNKKIPEYLLTGNCVLAYGPLELASIRIFSDNEIGLIIGSEEYKQQIKKLIPI